MRLIGSRIENKLREELISSKEKLFESPNGQQILNILVKICGEIKSVYILSHTPEQGEEFFCFLIDGKFVIGFELEYERKIAEDINIYSVEEYRRSLKGKIKILDFIIALELSKNDMKHSTTA